MPENLPVAQAKFLLYCSLKSIEMVNRDDAKATYTSDGYTLVPVNSKIEDAV